MYIFIYIYMFYILSIIYLSVAQEMYNIKHPPSCTTLTYNTFKLKVNINYAAMIVFIFFKKI